MNTPVKFRFSTLFTVVLYSFFTLILVMNIGGCFTDSEKNDSSVQNFRIYLPVYNPLSGVIDTQTLVVPQPLDNPMTPEGVELGMFLFHDVKLSGDRTKSCSSCHIQGFSFTDNHTRFSSGITSETGKFNAPALVNLAFDTTMFWDGRANSLESQALGPISNPIEMGGNWIDIIERLSTTYGYPDKFFRAFGSDKIDSISVTRAIAQYERTLLSFNSKFDKIQRGEESYTAAELRGSQIFMTDRGGCFHCHGAPLFTDNGFHNNGLEADSLIPGTGRGGVTGIPSDDGLWNTPTLRNVEYTAPYMHDGRLGNLEDVIEFYATGGHSSRTVDTIIAKTYPIRKYELSLDYDPITSLEKKDLLAFLKTLSDPYYLWNPDYRP